MALPKGKYYSVNETASLLGLSEKTIRRRIKSGTLTNKKVGREYQIYIPTEDLPLQDDPTLTKIKEDKIPPSKPGTKKEHPEETKTEKKGETSDQEKMMMLDNLIKDNQAKTKLIDDLSKQVADIVKTNQQVVFMLRDLRHQLPSGRKEDEIFEVVSKESGNEDTQPTKDKKQVWKYPLYVLILMATLGLIGLMLYQSGLITL